MKILLAVDGSPHSEAAVDEVARLPWPEGSHVRVISVAELPLAPPAHFAAATSLYPELLEAARRGALAAAEGAAAKLRPREAGGLTVDTVTPTGHARELILAEAEGWRPDLIVLGSQGRGFWGRLFLGSVSSAVASHAGCSVEIVRGPCKAEGGAEDAAGRPAHP